MKIILQEKNSKDMRYSTAGDYYKKDRVHYIDVVKQKKRDYSFMIMIHELIEMYLTEKVKINENDIMQFDLMFEDERAKGIHSKFAEPGEDKRACYFKEHAFAVKIEKQICSQLGYDWEQYNKDLISATIASKIDKKIGK
jgi:hypothetical protein